MKHRFFIIAAVAICAAMAPVGCLWLHNRALVSRAATIVRETERLCVGKATEIDLLRLASQYDGAITKDNRSTEVVWQFDNRFMSRLHLSPPARLTIQLVARNRLLSYVAVTEYFYDKVGYGYQLQEARDFTDRGIPDRFRLAYSGTCERIWKVMVYITPRATRHQKEVAFAVVPQCLSRVGGCRSAQQFAPKLSLEMRCTNLPPNSAVPSSPEDSHL